MSQARLLVDARPVDHPTARQRGIGRYVTGLLTGLRDVDASAVALYGTDTEREVLEASVPGLVLRRWNPQVVRDHPDAWFVATQLMLHPIPLDPIPRCITDGRLAVAAVMYDVIPYRHPERYLTDPNALRQAQLRAPLARTVDAMLAISDFAADTAAVELAYPRDRIVTIGAGVESRFSPPADGVAPRPPILPDGPYVVAVAGADERKNTDGLLRAWADVAGRTPHTLVVIAAHTPAVLDEWARVATQAGVRDRVLFTGAVDDDDLVALLRAADLAVMPSFEEGFGLPVLEAAACGVPSIASDVSSLPEVLADPAACFNPHDPAAIAAAIVRALTDDDHRAALFAAGRRAVERWTWANAAQRTMDAIDTLGPRRRQHPRTPPRRIGIAGRPATSGDRPDVDSSGDDAGTAVDRAGVARPDGAAADRAGVARPDDVVADRAGAARPDDVVAGHSDVADGSVVRALVEAVRASGAEVIEFEEVSASAASTAPGPGRWPVRAVGRYVKPWDLDHLVAVLGAAPTHLAVGAVARSTPCHLWVDEAAVIGLRFGANLAALELARSVIVDSIATAELLRAAADRPCPILVVPADAPHAAYAVVRWLDEVDTLDPTTIRIEPAPVASADP